MIKIRGYWPCNLNVQSEPNFQILIFFSLIFMQDRNRELFYQIISITYNNIIVFFMAFSQVMVL